jgi:protein-disulfide isomerase
MAYILTRAIAVALAFLALLPVKGFAADAPQTVDSQRAIMESVVHDYLLNHPEIILQAVKSYQEKLEADKEKTVREVLANSTTQLLRDPDTQSIGNASGDCAIVEFFDNQCPYCQANEPVLQALLKQDKRIRLVLKEFPILGPISVDASKAALASVKQGKYVQFHAALLAHKGHYEKAAIVDDIAKTVGLDLDRLHKDMQSTEIAAALNRNLDLGRALDINGTPGFIIGDQVIGGATTLEDLKKYVADACKASG